MRTIEETSRFRRDFKREKRGIHSGYLDRLLESTVHMLANDLPLPRRFFDHQRRVEGFPRLPFAGRPRSHISPRELQQTAQQTEPIT